MVYPDLSMQPVRKISLAALCLSIAMIANSRESDGAAQFAGAWKLISYDLRFPSGTVSKPFGEQPSGRILYQTNGQMSAQLMKPELGSFASADPLKATKDEAEGAWRNYIGYWGTYRVDAKAKVVVHRIEGGWLPNWVGQEQIRSFRFSGNQLILEADTTAWHATLVWQRID